MAHAVPLPPSPDVTVLPYGTKLVAGLGEATVLADLDFETYSEAGFEWSEIEGKWIAPFKARKKGLMLVGSQVYVEHPTAEVICAAYDLKDGKGRRLWLPSMPPPLDLFEHLAKGLLVEAFNSGFEEKVWNVICVKKYGWPPLDPELLICAAAKSRAHCLPGALGKVGQALDIAEAKDTGGKRLIQKFSIPRKPTKKNPNKRVLALEDLEDGVAFYKYCLQDIVAEANVSALTPDLSDFELRYWKLDQECNRAGVRLDREAVMAAIEILEEAYATGRARLQVITNGEVDDVTKVAKIATWLGSRGVHTTSIDAEHVDELLAGELPDDCREVLQLRKDLGSAAVKKLYTMRVQMTDAGRVHDMFVYHGARTGRDAGRGLQPQNFPNSGPEVYKCSSCNQHYDARKHVCPFCSCEALGNKLEWNDEAAGQAIHLLKTKQIHLVYEDLSEVLSGCLRGLMIADEGCDFISSDYSAIEAVVSAALAGEEWRMEVFRRKECIYLASASRITGVPVQHYLDYKKKNGVNHKHRKLGKIAELSSGFGGWLGSWVSFGAADHLSSEEEIKQAIMSWREASPNIVEAWGGQTKGKPWEALVPYLYGLEGAFIKAFLNPGVTIPWKNGVSYLNKGGNVYCVLPSGRAITYHNVSLFPDPKKKHCMKIFFWGWNTNPKMGQLGWVKLNTYGGRLFENVVQATARDIMAWAAVKLNDVGYKVRLRVHDELVTIVPEGWGSVEEMEEIAGQMPSWAKDWPVRASGGWRGKRFRK